jgi:hypothetical protein
LGLALCGAGVCVPIVKLAGKLLKIEILPHVLGENDGGEFQGMAIATIKSE